MPTPFNAIIASPGGVTALAIHRVDLAQALAFITHQRCFNGLGGRQAALKPMQYGRPQIAVAHGLRADGTDARFQERAGGANRQIAGSDGNREGARGRVMRDNGPGHAAGLS
jgi:hypothetical protein